MAYSPLRQIVVEEEATSDGDDDDDGCELVAYPPVRVVKTESELEDGQNKPPSEIQVNKLSVLISACVLNSMICCKSFILSDDPARRKRESIKPW